MSRSLVTGGAGFIGSHTVDALLAAGDEVLAIDDLSTGSRANLAAAEAIGRLDLVEGDITDPGFLNRELSGFKPDRVFHFAAQVDVRKAVADPVFDARVNVLGTINLLEAIRAVGNCPLVFASTGGVIYGEGAGRDLPFREDTPTAPETAYGASKLAGEVYLALYRRLHGLPALALRFGNVYGPRQDPHGEAGVVAIFCGKLLAGEAPTIFGDGEQTRDYVFVSDVVAAALAAADGLAADGDSLCGPYNVGGGEQTSVLDLLDGLVAVSGTAVTPEHAPERAGEISHVSIDPARARADLGWRAQTSLRDGLAASWSFVRERG